MKSQWIELPSLFQMIRSQVRVPHGHRQTLVPQDPLQSQDVAPRHHEVAGERVAQHVRHLSHRQLNFRTLHPFAER